MTGRGFIFFPRRVHVHLLWRSAGGKFSHDAITNKKKKDRVGENVLKTHQFYAVMKEIFVNTNYSARWEPQNQHYESPKKEEF